MKNWLRKLVIGWTALCALWAAALGVLMVIANNSQVECHSGGCAQVVPDWVATASSTLTLHIGWKNASPPENFLPTLFIIWFAVAVVLLLAALAYRKEER